MIFYCSTSSIRINISRSKFLLLTIAPMVTIISFLVLLIIIMLIILKVENENFHKNTYLKKLIDEGKKYTIHIWISMIIIKTRVLIDKSNDNDNNNNKEWEEIKETMKQITQRVMCIYMDEKNKIEMYSYLKTAFETLFLKQGLTSFQLSKMEKKIEDLLLIVDETLKKKIY